ncbi:MAG: hypothetical protein WCT04_11845 [Planctomycetota bacterium]
MRFQWCVPLFSAMVIIAAESHASEGGDDLIKLAKSGADKPAIFKHIQESPIAYDLSVAEIVALTDLGMAPSAITFALSHGKRKRGEPVARPTTKGSPGFAELVQALKSKASEDALLAQIAASKTAYDLSVDELLYLKSEKCPMSVITKAVEQGKAARAKAGGIALVPANEAVKTKATEVPPLAQTSKGFDELVKLAASGISVDALVFRIDASSIAYDLSVAEILRLHAMNVSPRVITAAINQGRAKRGEPVLESKAAPSPGFVALSKLIKANAEDDIVLGLVSSAAKPYDVSPGEMLQLRDLGASMPVVEGIVLAEKNIRTLGAGTPKDAAAAMDLLNLRQLIKTEPRQQVVLKNKAGKELALCKWTQDDFTVFMLTDNKTPLKTMVSIASTTEFAEYKTEEYKVESAPGVTETRLRQVCITPERMAYSTPTKTVLSHTIYYDYANGPKSSATFKQGTVTIGAEEFEIVAVKDNGK